MQRRGRSIAVDLNVQKQIRLINTAGAFGTIYARLATIEILVLFVTKCLGIPKETWALVAALVPATSLFQILSAYLAERFRRRKLLCLASHVLSRATVPLIALLPFLTGPGDRNTRLFGLAVALIVQNGLGHLATAPWFSWVADVVPLDQRGKFYSSRLVLTTFVDVVTYVSAGHVLDLLAQTSSRGYEDPLAYLVIFGFAFIAGEIDIVIHSRVVEPPMPAPAEKLDLRELFLEPWQHDGFRRLMTFRMFLSVSDGIIGPFALMYLFDELHLSASQVCGLGALFLLTSAGTYRLWHRIGERFGYRTCCSAAYVLSGIGFACWWFVPLGSHGEQVIILAVMGAGNVLQGMACSGWNLALSTLTMNIAPRKHLSMYFAQISVVLSFVIGLSVWCGRELFILTDPHTPVYFLGTKLTGVHVLIGIMALIRICAPFLLSRRVPDAKAEAAAARLDFMLRANPFRIFPMFFASDRPLSAEERAEHVESMTELVPADRQMELGDAIRAVLRDRFHLEDEFYGILGRERTARGRGFDRMIDEVADFAALHGSARRAKAAARRIERLYDQHKLAPCLKAIRHFAHRTAADAACLPPVSRHALSVIDALQGAVPAGQEPREEAVLLAVYACLQMVRESPDETHRPPREEPA